jgi:WD40 repeat protein
MLYSFATLSGHKNNVNCVEVGRDNVIVSGSSDETLKVHELKSRAYVGSLSVADFGLVCKDQTRFWCVT